MTWLVAQEGVFDLVKEVGLPLFVLLALDLRELAEQFFLAGGH